MNRSPFDDYVSAPYSGVYMGVLALVVLWTFLRFFGDAVRYSNLERSYQYALEELREEPNNEAARERVLITGRTLGSWKRRQYGQSPYNEQRIMDDIREATFYAVPKPSVSPAMGEAATARRMRELADLHQAGLVTDVEFEAKRRAILDEL